MARALPKLSVETLQLSSLQPSERNPRTHSKKQIRQIADSIESFGWTNPILIDETNRIVAGHGRLKAARLLGLETVPAIRLEDMTDVQIRAYVIADNKLAELAGWDDELLAIELQALTELDLDFDIEITGFAMGEIDSLIDGLDSSESRDAADLTPELDDTLAVVSKPGDLWQLGRHRLLCGNALDLNSYKHLMNGDSAQMVFTDPPYNVRIDGHVCGLGSVKHAEFSMASGEMSEDEFSAFLKTALTLMAKNTVDGAIHFVCMDWRSLYQLLSAGRSVYSELKNLCVWNKTNGGMGSLYRSKHELVAVFKAGHAPHINNVELGANGRYRTNVWDYAGINTFGKDRDAELAMYPTVKPVALVEDAIKDCSKRGGIILDAFCGSGTSILAADRSGRRCYGLEIDPIYVDVTIRRYEAFTGKTATHAETGLNFAQLRKEREGMPEMSSEARHD